jgi:peptide subunit release factor 1 (eRF1)
MADTDEQKIAEIRKLTERMAADKARIFELIPQVFPEKRGEPPVRGRLNEVVAASGFTREYVARIRDGKVKPS